jgi:hypothetical protein
MKCLEIGGDGQRAFSADNTVTIEGKYVAICPRCGKRYHKYRRFKRLRYCYCTKGMNDRWNPSNALQFRLNTGIATQRIAAQEQLVEMD